MALNYPPGVDNSHPHFHEADPLDECPECGTPVGDDVYCESCGATLDPDEAAADARFSAEEEGWREW